MSRPWKDGRMCEVYPDGTAKTFVLGKPTEGHGGTSLRESWEDLKTHSAAEWRAMQSAPVVTAPKSITFKSGATITFKPSEPPDILRGAPDEAVSTPQKTETTRILKPAVAEDFTPKFTEPKKKPGRPKKSK